MTGFQKNNLRELQMLTLCVKYRKTKPVGYLKTITDKKALAQKLLLSPSSTNDGESDTV